jgi:hypothetical protein
VLPIDTLGEQPHRVSLPKHVEMHRPLSVPQYLDIVEDDATTRVCEAPREPKERHDSPGLQLCDFVEGGGCQKAVRHPLKRLPDPTRRRVEEDRALPVSAIWRRGVAEQPEGIKLESRTMGLIVRGANELHPSEH